MYFKLRTNERLCEEILERTLDVPWTWRRSEELWESYLTARREVELRSNTDATTISGDMNFKSVSALSLGILRRMKNEETIHFTAETSIPNHSFCNSAQYLRSSVKLEWTAQSKRGQAYLGGVHEKRRVREYGNAEECELT